VIQITIRDSLYFSFAGEKSINYGILNVTINNGMQEEPLSYTRTIDEVSTKGRDRPYFQGIKKEPLKFNVSFAFEESWDEQKIREVTRWLTEHDYYQELYFTNDFGIDPERIYYALFVDDPVLIHNSLKQGYINLSVRCDGPYSYSPVMTSRLYIWDQEKYSSTTSNFQDGDKKSVVLDTDGSLILNPHKTKWSDFPYDMKWSELDQLFT